MRSTSHNGGIWITSYFCLLSVAILGGASSQRPQRDVPVVGIGPLAPVAGTVRRSSAFSGVSYQSATGVAIEDELIRGLETDDQVTVVAPVEFGELLCDTLAMAEDALSLSFVLLDDETIVAAKSSYTVANGSTFTDGVGRKVWTGIVTNPPQADDEAVPRTVSMAWGDVCDTETFLLKVTKRSSNGKTRVTKTVPCDGSTTHTCLVEVVLDFNEPGDPIVPDEANAAGDAISGAFGSGNSTDLNGPSGSSPEEENHPAASSPHERRLHDSGNTVIDVMVLYSVASLVTMGVITPAQMETIILEGLVGTNEAFVNSEVPVYFNPVHIGQLPFEDTPVKSGDMLFELQQNEEVRGLRDSTGADLVQMIGYFTDDFCGLGYFYFDEAYGFSVVRAACIDNYTHTHEFGHNLGCYHNREDSEYDNDYAHGLRYCEGAQPYRTLMSYSCGNPRVNYFSNPDVTLRGRPTGRLTEDNARAIEDNMVAVSNFRKRPTTATPLAPTPTISLPTIAPHTGVPPATVSPTTTPPATTPSTTATPPAAHVSAAIPTPTSTTVPPATPLQVITPISIPATTPAETPNDAATPAIIPATALGFRGRQSS